MSVMNNRTSRQGVADLGLWVEEIYDHNIDAVEDQPDDEISPRHGINGKRRRLSHEDPHRVEYDIASCDTSGSDPGGQDLRSILKMNEQCCYQVTVSRANECHQLDLPLSQRCS